jgi:hypothetical protein
VPNLTIQNPPFETMQIHNPQIHNPFMFSEQIEKADLGTNANANIADPDGNSSVKIAHSEVEDGPIKGGPTASCSPVGTTPTEVDSGYVEKDNMDIDDTGADADWYELFC